MGHAKMGKPLFTRIPFAKTKEILLSLARGFIPSLSMKSPLLKLRKLLLFLGWAALATLAASGQTATSRPNIVFIFSDDHSLQTIGAYGGRLGEFCRQQGVTPHIDRLAAAGGLFINSFCGNSLCSPSRATVLTGLHSHKNGVRNLDEPLPPGIWTYPRALREAGYQTAMFGKWHLSTTRPETDYWRILPGQGAYLNPAFLSPSGRETHSGYVSDVTTDLALEWLQKRDPSKPFFLAVQHKAPHRNWIPPARYAHWLDEVTVPEPETLFDDYSHRASPARLQEMTIAKDMDLASDLKVSDKQASEAAYAARNADFARRKPAGEDLTRWKYQHYMKDYLRCIKSVDDSVGKIQAALKAAGLEEKTIVIYSSDQGFFNGEHGWFDKRWIYEESLHMPLIIRWPGVVKPASRFTPFVQNIDYAPTFAAMAGGKVPAGLHGRSLVPILQGKTPSDWRQSVYYHYYAPDSHNVPPHYGVRTDRFTLANFYQTGEWELFDNRADPLQMKSVYADPAYTNFVVQLKTELARLRKFYQDPDGPEVSVPKK